VDPDNQFLKLIGSSPPPTLDRVVLHEDFAKAVEIGFPPLLDFVCPEGGGPNRLPEAFQYLFEPTEAQLRSSVCVKVGSALVNFFSTPGPLGRRLLNSPCFRQELKGFLLSDEKMQNSIYAGRFQRIVFALWKAEEKEMRELVPDFLSAVLANINVLAWQEALVQLIVDFPANVGSPFDSLLAHKQIAQTAEETARALTSDTKAAERLKGLYVAVTHGLQRLSPDYVVRIVSTIEVFQHWVESVRTVALMEKPNEWILVEGARLIHRLVQICQKAKLEEEWEEIENYVAAVSRSLWRAMRGQDVDLENAAREWEKEQRFADPRVALFVMLFPAFPQAFVEPMLPLILCHPEVSSEFGRAYVKFLVRWHRAEEAGESSELTEFVVRTSLFERLAVAIRPSFPVEVEWEKTQGILKLRDEKKLAESPHVFALWRLISTGTAKPKARGNRGLEHVPLSPLDNGWTDDVKRAFEHVFTPELLLREELEKPCV
jgi:hypothetical protein